jgi:hypothetical protein
MTRRVIVRRQRAQTIALAAVGMMALVGALSMVVDAGLFFVAERNMQSAADAAALAAVWSGTASGGSGPCASVDPVTIDPQRYGGCDLNADAVTTAQAFLDANLNIANGLCSGPHNQLNLQTNVYPGFRLNIPNVSVLVVTVQCDARHWFTGVFPDLPLTKHISVSAAATIGWPSPNPPYDIVGSLNRPITATDHLIARLIGAPA